MVLGVLLKRAALFFAVLCAAIWTSCGGGSSSGTTQVSKIKDRALFDNTESGAVNILNIDTNPPTLYQTTVAAYTEPKQMYEAPNRSFILIYDDSTFTLNYFNSSEETTTTSFSLNYHTDSVVIAADGLHAYAALPNNPELNAPPGVVLTFDLTTGLAGVQIPVAGARRLALSGDGKSLLVFADNDNSVYYIDLTATTITAVSVPGFNHPYTAYFSSDNSTAYVLNCGTECSGTTAPSVQPLAVSTTARTPGTPVPVPGATVGYLNGTTLYVAGNDLTKAPGSQGMVSAVNLSNMTVTNSAAIADGLHKSIVSFDNKLWIGSWNCTTTNCLSIYDTTSNAVTIGSTTGNVTGLTPVTKQNWMYVVQGGELYQYDPTKLTATMPFDIVGQGWDIKLLDQ